MDLGPELVEKKIQKRLKRRILGEEINVKKDRKGKGYGVLSWTRQEGIGGCQIQGVSDILSLERGRKKERK